LFPFTCGNSPCSLADDCRLNDEPRMCDKELKKRGETIVVASALKAAVGMHTVVASARTNTVHSIRLHQHGVSVGGEHWRLSTILTLCLAALVVCCSPSFGGAPDVHVPVLVYHRFGSRRLDSMTVTTPVFRDQMRLIQERGYHVIRIRELINYLLESGPAPPPKSLVITADDGHSSIFSDMYPVIRTYGFPVTLFIYPSAISNAHWAMTWAELQILQQSGLFDIESHTYWHPNFQQENERRSRADYKKFVDWQLLRSKELLENKLHNSVDLLAWPFGICTPWLMSEGARDGYIAAFSIVRRSVTKSDSPMALPRFIVTDADRADRFLELLSE
jgi:peptidoglycan/xylan/chitin deacetylase (PgdA/CDA1 family)